VTAAPTLARLLGSWGFDPVVVASLLAAAGLYGLGAVRAGARWPAWRAASFLAGLATIALALLSGIDGYAEELLSVHMVQHLLLSLLAPVLLLWGRPVGLALRAAGPRVRGALGGALSSGPARTIAQPAVGLALFAATVLVTHLTGLFELALTDPSVHALEHAAMFWSGLAFLAPLVSADPLPHPPAPLARFAWLMGGMTAMAVPGALLAFARTVRYPHYLLTSHALDRSALADQQLGGAIMWVGGTLAMFALALLVTFGAMLAEERRAERRERYADATAEPASAARG
jgi:cytochrome c oxidase assembly factor CtaG